MNTPQTVLPRWFIRWRWLTRFAVGLLVYTLLMGYSAQSSVLNIVDINTLNRITHVHVTAFMVVSIVSLIVIILGIANNAIAKRRQLSAAVNWSAIIRPTVYTVGTFAVTVVVGTFLLSVPPIFYTITATMDDCTYPYRVVAFLDQNHNGIRDGNDPGLADVTVTYPSDTNLNATDSTVTDSSGLAPVEVTYVGCPTRASHDVDTVTLVVNTPPGYHATTPTTIGPLLIKTSRNFTYDTLQTIYVGFATNP